MPLRVVVAGVEDVPDRAVAVARALRDAGHEVVVSATGTTDGVTACVLQEDADAVVVVPGAGAGSTHPVRLVQALAASDADDVLVLVVGGPDATGDGVVHAADAAAVVRRLGELDGPGAGSGAG